MIVSRKNTGCSLDKSPGDKWNFLACLFFISFMHLFINALPCSLNIQSVRSQFLDAKPRRPCPVHFTLIFSPISRHPHSYGTIVILKLEIEKLRH